jgi:hypothetical protein
MGPVKFLPHSLLGYCFRRHGMVLQDQIEILHFMSPGLGKVKNHVGYQPQIYGQGPQMLDDEDDANGNSFLPFTRTRATNDDADGAKLIIMLVLLPVLVPEKKTMIPHCKHAPNILFPLCDFCGYHPSI